MRAGMLALAAVLILMDWPGSEPPGPMDQWQEPVTVTGHVCDPAKRTSGNRLAFVLCRVGPEDSLPRRIRVTVNAAYSRHEISGGLRVRARLRPPTGPLNEGGGGFERWLWQERIGALATATELAPAPAACGLSCRYHQARITLIQRLDAHLGRLRHPELAEALVLGSRAGLRSEDWERLNATGTQHLVAISGLHVGLVAAFVGLTLGGPIRRRVHRHPAAGRWIPFALVSLVATGYALLAGFTVPTQRALVMVIVGAWVLTSGRRWRLWDAWLVALALVVVVEPRAVWGAGFWLSFGAVACLILGLGARFTAPAGLMGLLLAQLVVVAGLAPLLLWHDMVPAGIAFPVNLVAIPWLSVVVMPVLLVATPLILVHPVTAGWVAPGVDMALTPLWVFLGWAETHAFGLPVPTASVAAFVAGIVFCMLLPLGWFYRALAVAVLGLVPFSVTDPGASASHAPVLRIPDGVGGPVVLVDAGQTTLLFDGRKPGAGTRAITRDRLAPWLEAHGVRAVDHLVLAHPEMKPDTHWRSPTLPTVGHATEARNCGAFDQTIGGLVHVAGLETGEDVCTLVVDVSGQRALLTGPVDRRGERRLLRQLGEPERIGLLLAPRGGVGRSSQLGFIEALVPAVSVVAPPDWYQGEAGTPALARYRKAGGRVVFTPHAGEVTLVPAPEGWRLSAMRDCGQKARLC